MRLLVLLLGAALAYPIAAQDRIPKKAKKQVAHKKPTPEQIRKFNELESKRKKE